MATKLKTIGFQLLVLGFSTASWIGINTIWVELPLLVPKLPEGWNLPSYLAVIVQVGNIGPLVYFLLQKFSPKIVRPQLAVYVVLCVGILAMILTAKLWDSVSIVGGIDHSLALFCLTFLLATVNCSSNVICLPYMCKFNSQIIPVYFMGMGLSGFVPSVIALIQGAGTTKCSPNGTNTANQTIYNADYIEPLFSADAFFGIVAGLMFLSLICFILMENTQLGYFQQNSEMKETDSGKDILETSENSNLIPTSRIIFYLVVTGWVCTLMDSFLPSIQSYAALPYGNLVYHLVVVLSGMANPVGSMLASFLRATNVIIIMSLTTVATAAAALLIALAALSPKPLLIAYDAGGVLPIVGFIISTGFMAYIRSAIGSVLRDSGGEKYLLWCGIVTQLGSLIGAAFIFPLVNVYQIFTSAAPCSS